jgi:hypothetical protein
VAIQRLPIVCEVREDRLVQHVAPGGKPLFVVVGLVGCRLEDHWVQRVSGIGSSVIA